MTVKPTNLTDSPRKRPGRKRLKIASGPGSSKVLDLMPKLREKKYGNTGKSLQGRGFPADHLVGPDEWPFYGFTPPGTILTGLGYQEKDEE